MNSLVLYASQSGNTRKLADVVYDVLPGPKKIYPVDEAPDSLADFDFIGVGFWFQRLSVFFPNWGTRKFFSLQRMVRQGNQLMRNRVWLLQKKSQQGPQCLEHSAARARSVQKCLRLPLRNRSRRRGCQMHRVPKATLTKMILLNCANSLPTY
jgi:hypothetical protein